MLTNAPLATAITPPFAGGRDAWSGSGLLPVRRRQSSRDGTLKLLLELPDGQTIESVSMPMPATRSICLSSQVGCPLGCTFCRTGLAGFVRNLTAAEILAQARATALESHAVAGFWPERAVFMGMGEPLLNFEALRDCLTMLTDRRGPHLSWRKIQVSTAGIPDRLEELGRRRLALPAISLHAPTQELRDRLMPGAGRWPLRDLIPVLAGYPLPGRERITIEYILIRDTNDSDGQAEQLHELLREVRAKVNLIPCNPVAGSPHAPPDPGRVEGFVRRLKALGSTVFVRRSLGPDILAACGQLRGAEAGGSPACEMKRSSTTEAP